MIGAKGETLVVYKPRKGRRQRGCGVGVGGSHPVRLLPFVIVQMEPEAIYPLLFGFASLMASKTEPSEVKELASIVASSPPSSTTALPLLRKEAWHDP